MKVRKAVIPAAGLGTRFLPATKSVPKEMLPVVDKPVIQYIVEEAVASGIEQVIIVTSAGKRTLEDHFDYHYELEHRLEASQKQRLREQVRAIADMADFVFVRQHEPLGNGHAVLQARHVIGDEPFGMLWGDDLVISEIPCLRQLIEVYQRYNAPVAAVMQVPPEDAVKYGVIAGEHIGERVWRVRDLVEKPPADRIPSNLAVVKEYLLTPDIFDYLERTQRGVGGEIWLADAVRARAAEHPVYALEFVGRRYDVGNKQEYLEANVELGLKHPEVGQSFREYLTRTVASFD
jgi:UTP--glucose-1-phosphate uridylyltransferase